MTEKLRIRNLSVKYDKLLVVKNLDISIKDGEFISLVGSSGCGKSTIINATAGFIKPIKGNIFLDNIQINQPTQKIGIIFQNFELFPWKTVFENIAFGLRLHSTGEKEIKKRVMDYIKSMELNGFENYYPRQLSEGMKERVGLARTIINNPEVVLMDEPFGALDYLTKLKMQNFLTQLLGNKKITVLLVTHDIDEAIKLSNKIVVLSKRPARILDIIPIDKEKISTEDKIKIRERILHLLQNDG
ncbi:ABC transporter ATP-binding protein [Candidatus Woesearchaeota archaeon]|nr:ABC transporter ATP-binding protein [Candidatus Woesearchaeota archaeon]